MEINIQIPSPPPPVPRDSNPPVTHRGTVLPALAPRLRIWSRGVDPGDAVHLQLLSGASDGECVWYTTPGRETEGAEERRRDETCHSVPTRGDDDDESDRGMRK